MQRIDPQAPGGRIAKGDGYPDTDNGARQEFWAGIQGADSERGSTDVQSV
jgi:hypothetical protein